MKSSTFITIVFLLVSCGRQEKEPDTVAETERPGKVRVAAIQIYTRMGETERNLERLARLIKIAARNGGAEIIVLPECAVHGYMYPPEWINWSKTEGEEDSVFIDPVAESIPGPSSRYLADLAKKLSIYLAAGILEKAGEKYYNSQILIGPKGKILARHRKKALWKPGDGSAFSEGNLPVQVVDTKFGRIGLMICYDFHVLPEKLGELQADIVLYSLGWYGPNEENWFTNLFPRKAVVPYGYHIVCANWAAPDENDIWPGCGYSCIIAEDGTMVRMADTVSGEEIVIGELILEKEDSGTD